MVPTRQQHQLPQATWGQKFSQFGMSFGMGCLIGFTAAGATGVMSGGFNKKQAVQSGLFMGIVIGFGSLVRY